MYNSGFIPTEFDGTEYEYKEVPNSGIPTQYSYIKYLPLVINQGSDPICVPCSISSNINWNLNLKDGSKKDHNVNLFEIFNKRGDNAEGMTFKKAFQILSHDGVSTNSGIIKINKYARIPNIQYLKSAIINNGPCVGVLPVYNTYITNFWNDFSGDLCGYHAISIVGYDENGFIIRNSWGTSYGKGGYSYIENKDINKFLEIWTIIN